MRTVDTLSNMQDTFSPVSDEVVLDPRQHRMGAIASNETSRDRSHLSRMAEILLHQSFDAALTGGVVVSAFLSDAQLFAAAEFFVGLIVRVVQVDSQRSQVFPGLLEDQGIILVEGSLQSQGVDVRDPMSGKPDPANQVKVPEPPEAVLMFGSSSWTARPLTHSDSRPVMHSSMNWRSRRWTTCLRKAFVRFSNSSRDPRAIGPRRARTRIWDRFWHLPRTAESCGNLLPVRASHPSTCGSCGPVSREISDSPRRHRGRANQCRNRGTVRRPCPADSDDRTMLEQPVDEMRRCLAECVVPDVQDQRFQ